MKRALIVALLCLNVGLLAALAISSSRPAYGQAYRGATDYMLITSKLSDGWDGVYVVDLAKRRMVGWKFDKQKKKLVVLSARDFKTDFRRTAE